MMRLVYTLLQKQPLTGSTIIDALPGCCAKRAVLPCITYNLSFSASCFRLPKPLLSPIQPKFIATLFFAACLLLPQFVQGQCYGLVCNQNVTVSLDDYCKGSVNPVTLFANYWQCAGPVSVKFYDNNGNFIGSTVNGNYIGQTLSVHVTHNYLLGYRQNCRHEKAKHCHARPHAALQRRYQRDGLGQARSNR